MDPLSAMLLALWIAGYFTKNVYQDAVFKARGEDPPSYRREQARRERRAQRDGVVRDGPGRQFVRNAWADAVASAEDRRERVATKAAEKRHAKWAEKDHAAAEDEAYKLNERLGPTSEPGESVVHDQVFWHCDQCGTQMMNAGQDAYQPGEQPCRSCRAPASPDVTGQCHFCRSEFPPEHLWPARDDDDSTVASCRPCWIKRNQAPEPNRSERDRPAPAAPDTGGADVIQFADWQRPAASDTEKEPDLSAEITGLRSAVAYVQGGATAAAQAAAQADVAIAGLQAGGTTGAAVTHLYAALEGHHLNAQHYNAARTDLTRQLQVTEQYEANPDAGTREFVTSD